MKRKWFFLFLMLTSVVLNTGCWSKVELTDLAIVAALGIDKNEKGQYVGTFQIVNPGNVAGGLQGGGGGQGSSVTVYSTTGVNIFDMSRQLSRKLSRRPYYAHTNLLVISEDLAKDEGITKLFDAFERDYEFRSTTNVVIADDTKAGDIVKTLTPIDKIPAEKVIKTLENTEKHLGEEPTVSIQEVIHLLVSPGKTAFISGFKLKGSPTLAEKVDNTQGTSTPKATLEANGVAVFKEGKLVDWFRGETTQGAAWILDIVKSTTVSINWKKEKEAIAYTVIRQKTKISAETKKDKPKILIYVRAEGEIGEVMVPVNLTDPHVLMNIEKVVEKQIKKEIMVAIKRAQKNKTDIFGFGEEIHRSDPELWKGLKNDWDDVSFPELEVDVTVDAFVRRSGLRNKSYLSDIPK